MLNDSGLFIFDMGGVVTIAIDVMPDIASHIGMSEDEFHKLADGNMDKLTTGEISPEEFWEHFSGLWGEKVEEELFGKFFHPRPIKGTFDLIKSIKENARVVCGTNTSDPHYNHHLTLGDYDIFDAVYASNKIGYSKPNPEFYSYILEMEGYEPGKAVFVDDLEENIIGAINVGITAVQFINAASLRLEFDRLGLFR